MDRLSTYIDSGNGKGLRLFFVISTILTLLISIFIYATLHQIPYQEQVQKLLNKFPTVTIQNGVITEPSNMLWTATDDSEDLVFAIDTRTEQSPETERLDGIYLLKTHLLLKADDTTQIFPWPLEDKTLTKQSLLDTFQDTLITATTLVAGIILVILWLGLLLTTLLTRFTLWLMRRHVNHHKITRSAVIGWTSVVFLNTVLVVLGYGFSVFTMVLLATVIAVVGIIHITQ